MHTVRCVCFGRFCSFRVIVFILPKNESYYVLDLTKPKNSKKKKCLSYFVVDSPGGCCNFCVADEIFCVPCVTDL